MKHPDQSSERKDETIGLALLEKKLHALKVFLSATEVLKGKIDKGDLGEIEKWSTQRQKCIDRINNIDGRINAASIKSGEGGERIKIIEEAIKEMLKTIIPLDETCGKLLAARCRNIQDGLSMLTKNKQSFRGYERHGNQFNRFLNVTT